jgi:hypothetical protein
VLDCRIGAESYCFLVITFLRAYSTWSRRMPILPSAVLRVVLVTAIALFFCSAPNCASASPPIAALQNVSAPSTAKRDSRWGPALDENFITMGNVLDLRIAFSRASSATFVGQNGLIQTAAIDAPRFDYNPSSLALNGLLIEQGSVNQQLDSNFNIFTGGIDRWYGSAASLMFNSGSAPDGTNSVATLVDDSVNGPHGAHYINGALPVGINPNIPFYAWPVGGPQVESCSMFLGAGTLSFAQVQLYENTSGAGVAVDVDLQTGTLGNAGPIGSGSTYLGSNITAYSNGIYRVSISAVIPDPHNLSCIPLTEDSLGNVSYSGTGGTIAAWGIDLENNPISTSYLYTASIPNLQLDSNNFAYWSSGGGNTTGCGNGIQCNSALATNVIAGPDGTITGAQLADNSTYGNHLTNHPFGLGGPGLIGTAGPYYTTVTCSAFFMQGTQRYAQLQCGTGGSSFVNNEANSGIAVDIDLQNGTIANGGTFGVSGSDQTSYSGSSIEALPNAQFPNSPPGWYRVSVTGTIIVEADVHIQMLLASSLGEISYAGTGSTIYIWGPQIEQHQTAQLSDYTPVGEIPVGATARAPDEAMEPLVGNQLNLPNFATGFSWIVSGITAPGAAGTQVAAELDDGSSNNAITLERDSNGHLRFLIFSGGTAQANLDLGAVPNGTAFRAGLNAQGGNFVATLDGSPLVTATGSMPSQLTVARYGSDTTGDYWNGWLRESALWAPTLLTNAQLQSVSAQAP